MGYGVRGVLPVDAVGGACMLLGAERLLLRRREGGSGIVTGGADVRVPGRNGSRHAGTIADGRDAFLSFLSSLCAQLTKGQNTLCSRCCAMAHSDHVCVCLK